MALNRNGCPYHHRPETLKGIPRKKGSDRGKVTAIVKKTAIRAVEIRVADNFSDDRQDKRIGCTDRLPFDHSALDAQRLTRRTSPAFCYKLPSFPLHRHHVLHASPVSLDPTLRLVQCSCRPEKRTLRTANVNAQP